ncbi:hypothetical protein FS837_005718 [Tulasnella sp. UAMH 9824]|nr:hypothetical protein FS837_005718 [Tulasnella sp. UAMH 9824]
MWNTTVILLLLSSILASASPIPAPPEAGSSSNGHQITKRGASVVHFRRSSSISTTSHSAPANVRLAQKERALIRRKWGKVAGVRSSKVAQIAGKVAGKTPYRRDVKNTSKLFDVKKERGELQGTDPLIDQWDIWDHVYWGAMAVGTPFQQTTVQFDTGSSDLVLPMFSISYVDESGASGVLVSDAVSVAGLTVPQQTFAAVSSEIEGFSDPYAGIMGLGFQANANSGATPFFAKLVQSGSLESNIFSFYMTRGGVEGSELCLGCLNSGKYTGDDGQPFDWDIQSTGLSYQSPPNNNTAGPPPAWKSEPFLTTIDSGTTFIYVSKQIAKAFYDQIPHSRPASKDWGEGSYAFPCDSANDIGTISFGFAFGDQQYAIDIRDFNAGPESDGSKECVGGIFGDDLWEDIAILGAEFMKNWYSVFDYQTLAIGFARAI